MMTSMDRDRSFDQITFFRNLSVFLSKFVSKEKISFFEFRAICVFLSNVVCLKIFQFSKECYPKEKNVDLMNKK